MRPHRLVPLLITFVVAMVDARVAPQRPDLISHWRAGHVIVDGSANEWEGLTAAVADLKVSVGVANDSEVLDLCLITDDLQTRELILRRGLIVWFDPGGGTRKAFGIKYPVGTFAVDKPRPSSRTRAAARDTPPEPIEIVNRVEIFGPGKDERRSLLADKVPGIRMRISQTEAGLIYELEVLLARAADRPYGIAARPGAIVGVGLETPDLQKGITITGEQPRSGASGLPGGVSVGSSTGGTGAPPRGSDRERDKMPKPIKWWSAVRLATPAS